MKGVYTELYEALLEQLRPELRDKHNNGLNILSVFAEEMETRRVEREAERDEWAKNQTIWRDELDVRRADQRAADARVAELNPEVDRLRASIHEKHKSYVALRDAILATLRDELRSWAGSAEDHELIKALQIELAKREEALLQYREYYNSAQQDVEQRNASLAAALEREAKVSHDLALAQAATEEAQRQAATHRATIDNYQRHCADLKLAAIEMMIQFAQLAQRERARGDHHHIATSLRDHLPF